MADQSKPVKAPARGKAAPKDIEIADRRIYGVDAVGRRVLVAAEGQRIPDGFQVDGPAQDHARKGPGSAQSRRKRS